MSDDVRMYVAGFLFRNRTPVMKQVLLVRKTHPAWQANMLNGIGGKIDPGETQHQAMRREFLEEAHYVTGAWDYFAFEKGPGYQVYFFRHTLDHEAALNYVAPFQNDEGEELSWHSVDSIKYPIIGNLNWLIPLALDPRPMMASVITTGDIRKLVTW
jgi:8-oxo-dGTP pyrophosphatase MutT (NUDIX family)